MIPIVNDTPMMFSCAVCGSPINPLAKGLPDLLGEFSTKCKKCHKTVCNEHYNKNSKSCSKCSSKDKDWCGTLGL